MRNGSVETRDPSEEPQQLQSSTYLYIIIWYIRDNSQYIGALNTFFFIVHWNVIMTLI